MPSVESVDVIRAAQHFRNADRGPIDAEEELLGLTQEEAEAWFADIVDNAPDDMPEWDAVDAYVLGVLSGIAAAQKVPVTSPDDEVQTDDEAYDDAGDAEIYAFLTGESVEQARRDLLDQRLNDPYDD